MNASLSQRKAAWLQRPVAILGRGESGQAAANLILSWGGNYQFYCQDPQGHSQVFHSREAARHDLVLFSPGFALHHPWLETARAVGCELVGEIEFARPFWLGPVWTVTGTNGKTTTVSLLVHALRSTGRPAVAVGNIGNAFSRAILSPDNQPGTIAVCEVSSFQSESFQRWNSDGGIWTHFSPNHLDRHGSMEEYFRAKVRALQEVPGQHLFLGSTVWQQAGRLGLKELLPSSGQVPALPESDSRIPEFFRSPAQWENLHLVAALWTSMGFPLSELLDSLPSFQPPSHRLSLVRSFDGVEFWDDSKATNSAAVRAALDSFKGRPVRWIGGGLGKGESLETVANLLAPGMRYAYTVGSVGADLAREMVRAGVGAHHAETLDRAVDICWADCEPGDVVLLSPGFASFDQFRGYAERGECYQSKVLRLSSPVLRTKKKVQCQSNRIS